MALEDEIIQKAAVDITLALNYEEIFLRFSFGFRLGRGPHDALDALVVGMEQRKINWVLDADLRKCVDRGRLLDLLEWRIGDRRLIRLIGKWLRAGVMQGGMWTDTGRGTPQGAVISPDLANAYLHYALDEWAKDWRRERARGDMMVIRYADDFVVGFQ